MYLVAQRELNILRVKTKKSSQETFKTEDNCIITLPTNFWLLIKIKKKKRLAPLFHHSFFKLEID